MPPAAPTPHAWRSCRSSTTCPQRFAAAHLVMARSGASTVAELAAAGKPSLLVPFAAAADEHQKRNAEADGRRRRRRDAGSRSLATPGTQARMPGQDKLLDQLTRLLTIRAAGNHGRRRPHSSPPGAAERIADRLADLAGKSDRTTRDNLSSPSDSGPRSLAAAGTWDRADEHTNSENSGVIHFAASPRNGWTASLDVPSSNSPNKRSGALSPILTGDRTRVGAHRLRKCSKTKGPSAEANGPF